MLLGQLLVGIGIGIDFPVSASYVSETMPKHACSRMVVATIALQSVVMLLGGATDLAILRIWSSSEDWRLMIGAIGATALVFFLLRFWLPESPRWLRHHEHGGASARGTSAGSPRPGYALLFSRRYRTRTMLVSLPWFLMNIATYGVGLFTTIILGAISFSSDARGPLAAEFSNAEGTAAIDVFLLIGFLLGLWAVPRFGRIYMQVVGFVGMTIGPEYRRGRSALNGAASFTDSFRRRLNYSASFATAIDFGCLVRLSASPPPSAMPGGCQTHIMAAKAI